jgi:hypothetical protein
MSRIPPLTAVLFRYFHDAKGEQEVGIGQYPIVTLEKQVLNMIGNLV